MDPKTLTESFLPEDYLEKRLQRRTNVISLTLFVVVMGFVTGAFFVTNRQRSEVLALQEQVDSQYVDAARRLEQLDELQRRKQEMIRKAKTTSTLLERVPRTIVLAELINNMPPTLSLLELDLESKTIQTRRPQLRTAMDKAKARASKQEDAEAPPQRITEVSLKVVGVAPTDVQVAQFMASLGRARLFEQVNLAFSEEIKIGKNLMRKFSIDMQLNQAIDTTNFEPTMVQRELKLNPMSDRLQITPQGEIRAGPKPAVSAAAEPSGD